MKKRLKIIILIIIIVVVLLALITIYFLFFNKTTMAYFGFSSPDFSQTANLGDVVGAGTETNAWDNTKLNPFRNST